MVSGSPGKATALKIAKRTITLDSELGTWARPDVRRLELRVHARGAERADLRQAANRRTSL